MQLRRRGRGEERRGWLGWPGRIVKCVCVCVCRRRRNGEALEHTCVCPRAWKSTEFCSGALCVPSGPVRRRLNSAVAEGQLNVAKQQQQQQNRLKQFILEKKALALKTGNRNKRRICCCAKKLEQTKSAAATAEGNWTRSWLRLRQKTLGPSSVRSGVFFRESCTPWEGKVGELVFNSPEKVVQKTNTQTACPLSTVFSTFSDQHQQQQVLQQHQQLLSTPRWPVAHFRRSSCTASTVVEEI